MAADNFPRVTHGERNAIFLPDQTLMRVLVQYRYAQVVARCGDH